MRRAVLPALLAWMPLRGGGRVDLRPPAAALAPLDGPRVASCLARAGELLAEQRPLLSSLADRLEGGATVASGPFAAFEGSWRGHWQQMPVRQRWQTVAPGVQLVVVEDDGQLHEGINLAVDGVLCGLVREADGSFRAHEGRLVADMPGALIWRSTDRAYVEWVEDRRYHIQEWLIGGGAGAPGVRATYSR